MSESKSFTDAIKDALTKKQAAQHPDVKKTAAQGRKVGGNNAPKGPPQRRAASRGG